MSKLGPSRYAHLLTQARCWLWFALFVCCLPTWAVDVEYQVKAAYLYKFTEYVEWPPRAFAQADEPITIGVLGSAALAGELGKLLANRPASGRAVVMRSLQAGEALDGIHVLFIGRGENSHLKRLLDNIQQQPVLTVTESSGALDAGSVINFVPVQQRIRFEISLGVAERSGLKLSARLLAVAQQVQTGVR